MGIDATWRALARRYLTRNRIVFFYGLLSTFALMAIYLAYPSFRYYLENKIYDLMLAPTAVAPDERPPIIVDIDERSLAQYGQWPWPRYRVARLLDKIQSAGATAVGIDILFAEADHTSLKTIQHNLSAEFDTPLQLSGIPPDLVDNDAIMAQALSRGPFIMGYKFLFGAKPPNSTACRLHPFNLVVAHGSQITTAKLPLLHATGMACPLPQLASRSAGTGFYNATPDPDGSLRRLPLIIEYQGRYYPSLALAVLCRAHGITQGVLALNKGKIENLRAGKFQIPLDEQGNLLIHYRYAQPGFTYLSAADLLTNNVALDALAGRIVFLGTTAAGLEDHRVTPGAAVFHGVEAHATVVDNIQQGDLLSRPLWVSGFELILTMVSGLLAVVLLTLRRNLSGILLFAAAAMALWYGADWSLNSAGIYIAPVFPLLVMGVNFAFLTLLKFLYEERRVRERTKALALAQEFTIQSLAALAETRDQETGQHIYRVQRYVRTLCDYLKDTPKFGAFLDEGTIDLLYKSAPLHDIGKVGVPDRILLKQGKLDEDEYTEMKKHTLYGLEAIERAEDHFDSGSVSRFLRFAKDFTYTHHERWDGNGYPRGVAGEEIPMAGRLMSLADVYDALVSRRIYKPAFSHEKAVSIITEGQGTFFDPDIVTAFLEVEEQFRQIAVELADDTGQHPEDPERLMRREAQV